MLVFLPFTVWLVAAAVAREWAWCFGILLIGFVVQSWIWLRWIPLVRR